MDETPVDLKDITLTIVEPQDEPAQKEKDFYTVIRGHDVRKDAFLHACIMQVANLTLFSLKFGFFILLIFFPNRIETIIVPIVSLLMQFGFCGFHHDVKKRVQKIFGPEVIRSYSYLTMSLVFFGLCSFLEISMIATIAYHIKSRENFDWRLDWVFYCLLIIPSTVFFIGNQLCFRNLKLSLYNNYIIFQLEKGLTLKKSESVPLKMFHGCCCLKENRVNVDNTEEESGRY